MFDNNIKYDDLIKELRNYVDIYRSIYNMSYDKMSTYYIKNNNSIEIRIFFNDKKHINTIYICHFNKTDDVICLDDNNIWYYLKDCRVYINKEKVIDFILDSLIEYSPIKLSNSIKRKRNLYKIISIV